MEYVKKLDDFELKGQSVITLGKFDGVHRGHKKLIHRVQKIGREQGLKTVIFTFDVSPQARMGAIKAGMLMTNQERYQILKAMGLNVLVECPFTDAVRNMTAEDFVKDILMKRLHGAAIVVGADFHFGQGRSGNPEFLCRMGRQLGFEVEVLAKEKDGDREISSSYIREELTAGHMEKVNDLLGKPYYISGKILHGRHLGHSLGFPTINQIPEQGKLLPPKGVYISRTRVAGQCYQSITNIGKKPTVRGKEMGVESYLFQCSKNLYDQEACVELLSYRRPEQKFNSTEELKSQLYRDVQDAREYFEI